MSNDRLAKLVITSLTANVKSEAIPVSTVKGNISAFTVQLETNQKAIAPKIPRVDKVASSL